MEVNAVPYVLFIYFTSFHFFINLNLFKLIHHEHT